MTEPKPVYHVDGPAIQIEPSVRQPVITQDGRVIYQRSPVWVKLGVGFSRGESSILATLSGAEVKVFLAIALHIDENCEAFPSTPTLQVETGLSHGAVADAIKALEERGLIDVRRTPGAVNTYTIRGYVAYGQADVKVPVQKLDDPPSKNWTGTRPKTGREEEPVKQNQEGEPSAPAAPEEKDHDQAKTDKAETDQTGTGLDHTRGEAPAAGPGGAGEESGIPAGGPERRPLPVEGDGAKKQPRKQPWQPPGGVYGRRADDDDDPGTVYVDPDSPAKPEPLTECERWLLRLSGTNGTFTDAQRRQLRKPYKWVVPDLNTHAVRTIVAPAPIQLFEEVSPRGDDFRGYVGAGCDKARRGTGRIKHSAVIAIVTGWRYADAKRRSTGAQGDPPGADTDGWRDTPIE